MGDDGGDAHVDIAPAPATFSPKRHIPRTDSLPIMTPRPGLASGAQTPSSAFFGGNRGSRHIIEFDEYFAGPRDLDRHSKLPYFMQMHGSVMPRMIVPLLCIGAWSTAITCIGQLVPGGHNVGVSTLLLTVLGFVVGLALSFRSSTAYERYSDGRKAWATVAVQSRNLARLFWVHVIEREGEEGKDDLLAKVTALNMILAFSVALKHKLRFEPYAHYEDIASLLNHLTTYAQEAHDPEFLEAQSKKHSFFKRTGEYLGVSFAESNPRKAIKRASKPVGNLPLEILTFLSVYAEGIVANKTLASPIVYGQVLGSLASLTDTMATAERVLSTPLPIGYNILIAQIVIIYVYLLPFQLFASLGWITIPGTLAAAYIIMGLAAIGHELENPFGSDVNDLPLDQYCAEIGRELDMIMSVKAPSFEELVFGMGDKGNHNKVLWPLSPSGVHLWRCRDEQDIREALKSKVIVGSGKGSSGDNTAYEKTSSVRERESSPAS